MSQLAEIAARAVVDWVLYKPYSFAFRRKIFHLFGERFLVSSSLLIQMHNTRSDGEKTTLYLQIKIIKHHKTVIICVRTAYDKYLLNYNNMIMCQLL